MRIKRGTLRSEKHAGRQRLRARVTATASRRWWRCRGGTPDPERAKRGGYSPRARTEKGARGDGVEEGDLLVAAGARGAGVVSVVPG